MTSDEILLDVEERMEKAVSNLKEELRGIRTGRASPALVDTLRVEYYGSPTPLKQMAAISAPVKLERDSEPIHHDSARDSATPTTAASVAEASPP